MGQKPSVTYRVYLRFRRSDSSGTQAFASDQFAARREPPSEWPTDGPEPDWWE